MGNSWCNFSANDWATFSANDWATFKTCALVDYGSIVEGCHLYLPPLATSVFGGTASKHLFAPAASLSLFEPKAASYVYDAPATITTQSGDC